MKFNYCIECAAPLTRTDETDFVCSNGHPYWNNPKGTASVLFVKDGQVLVAKRAIEPFKGKYDTPGGFINWGENAYDAARREMKEETGVDAKNLELFEVYNNEYGDSGISTCDVFFVSTKWKGEFTPDDDVASLEWKPIEFLNETEQFAWPLPGVVAKLRSFLDNRLHD